MRILERGTAEESSIYNGEAYCIDSKAECECRDRDSRIPAFFDQQPQAVTAILEDILDPACSAGVAAGFLDLIRATELESRLPRRFLRIRAFFDQLCDSPFQVV